MVRLVIVTGSGRSGTSSVAGALKRLGFHIPQPEVEADERNPRGYYEPLWVAQFHKRWLNRVPVRTIDARPQAGAIAMASVRPGRRERLRVWLAEELADRGPDDVMVIKETRAYWVYPLWVEVAAEVGAEICSLTMLRHPTQVVRSRDAAYLGDESEDTRLQRETTNVAAWMNSVFETERTTRATPRAFVPYYDLIDDWRATLTRACDQLGLDPGDLTAPHPVDDFVTSSLNRSSDTWDGLTVPEWLRDAAEQTWDAAQRLVADPHDDKASALLDDLRASYAERYTEAAALAVDEGLSQVLAETRQLRQELQAKDERLEQKNQRLRELREEVRRLRAQAGGGEGAGGGQR